VMLLSVPYALKAVDSQTVGGLAPSAFMLAPSPGSSSASAASAATSTNVGGSGTLDYIPIWTDNSGDLGNSAMFQSGTSPTAKIGINTTTPAAALDVIGSGFIRGTLNLPATGPGTAAAGRNSQPFNLVASAFNSGTGTKVNQTFEWQAEPLGNNTASPSATLNLLFGAGANEPTETGLNIASNGQITFATGQTFPGTGSGTVTSVGSGAGLTGGPITGSGTLSLASNACAAGSALSALPFTCSPFATLGANTFANDQTVNGNVTAVNVTATQSVSGGVVNATTSFDLGGNVFAFGSNQNVFLGFFTGNTTMTGIANTASGEFALSSNTTGNDNSAYGEYALLALSTGSGNTATGLEALFSNTTGSYNTADGEYALANNSTGSYNTALGYSAGPSDNFPNLSNGTAIGAYAEVTASNSLVLGSINGVNGGTSNTNVGIGTTAPSRIFTIGQGFGHAIADGWDTYSSRRWKTNIRTLQGALAKVQQLRGVSYDLKESGKHEIGVIAEEVGAVVPEVVSWEKDGKGAQGVDYSRLTALLIEATKEQQALIGRQQEQIRAQQAQIKAQARRSKLQEAAIMRLSSQVRAIQASLITGDRKGLQVRQTPAVSDRASAARSIEEGQLLVVH